MECKVVGSNLPPRPKADEVDALERMMRSPLIDGSAMGDELADFGGLYDGFDRKAKLGPRFTPGFNPSPNSDPNFNFHSNSNVFSNHEPNHDYKFSNPNHSNPNHDIPMTSKPEPEPRPKPKTRRKPKSKP